MKKTILFFGIGLMLSAPASAELKCFIVKENNQVIKQEGECEKRYAPCSTFKIPLSLMGFDAGILKNETNPVWSFKEGYVDYIAGWKEPHNPSLWMKNSCVWYSQVITQKMGMNEFKKYVAKIDYGNQDVSGDKGKNNGLTNAWLSSSLEISPQEQVAFLQKLVANKLPLSSHAQEMTKNILFLEDLPHGWKLYGKTGSGSLLSADRSTKTDIMHGWFVGWIKKDDRTIVFANHITDDTKQDTYAGPRAKEQTKPMLLALIADLENNSKL